ncbi:MAG: hypothetical protein ING71_07620 [Rhodocyclaceae bacterium]|nr:hypothetical protein [Rhodocyclaceae bacterium]
MNGDEKFDLAAGVSSRADFIDFVDNLNRNYASNKDEWENDNLESFLGGLSGFANDMGGYYKNMKEDVDIETVTWRMAAQMLLAAKVYGN